MSLATETGASTGHTAPLRKPRKPEDARALISRAVNALRHIHSIEAKRDARIAYYQQKIDDLKNRTSKERDAKVGLIRRIMPLVYDYIETNRFELTQRGRRKTIGFPDGTFRWQARSFTDIPDEDAFYKEVRSLNLADEFIRVKEEPNRRALLDKNNLDKAQKLTTARIIEETRPQLATPGTTLLIERVKGEDEEEFHWDIVDSRER